MTVSQSPKTQAPTMATAPCCPNCGTSLDSSELFTNSASDPTAALLAAQKQIAELQAQVRLLNQKAAAAVDRWADYEDELTRLRAASSATNTTVTTTATTGALSATTAASSQYPPRAHTPTQSQGNLSTASATSPRASFLNAGASRISALLSPRSKAAQNNMNSTAGGPRGSLSTGALPLSPSKSGGLPSPAPSHDDLLEALSREQGLRLAAEGKLDETSKEVEELSATLFEQANEMVATERKARARLEERVEVLEKRDEEKRNRLERLEGAMGRIERVNRLLKD
ncbi:hypothetical protein G7054_g12342 [Neopestalotiopsis clavispora]|nr:hypothetical protein G7054_g12342 [Neopestalotiopsis clavispora]